MDKFKLEYRPYGDKALLIEWPRTVNEEVLNDILKFKNLIGKHLKGFELIPSYNSLALIARKPIDHKKLKAELKTLYKDNRVVNLVQRKLWHIPVCYDNSFGIDMEAFSLAKKMSVERIIELHTEPLYTIYCIGFLPGFMYLGGLNEALYQPRRTEPRLKIPQGSVGIGGKQTGVYPQESPGGWNIIGNSPVKVFNPENEDPCGVSVGDKIKFYPIDKATHELITIQVDAKIFHLETYELDDTSK
ncbi:5-oxoprolinase subunit PxpB [Galbibacter sp. EGI 63066]|uniref:5-oxoprolinase subunit PxpB n=1 Tax=Galbibacter sp. EGI 63066 TaxID=2993559 RepID=UPI002248FEA9|nr:5-oxoprolinase subunit PxpB [Galbibacter sp. EGI 63066]MCX2681488.1 5-oxoprolinase subunit PxpB [Galbibacter sp. EGI 63066]